MDVKPSAPVDAHLYPGNNNAFIGRASNFAGLGNSFLWGPNAEWQQPNGVATPLLDMAGSNQIYFEGIAFGAQQHIAIQIHDNKGPGLLMSCSSDARSWAISM